MAEKFAIYAGEPLANVLAGYEDQRSGRINKIAAEWQAMIDDNVPSLSESEWLAVIDACNGTNIDDAATLRLIWAEIADSDGLGEKWGIDQDALTEKLRGLSVSQRFALRELIARYWSAIEAGNSREASMRLAGMVV